MKRTSDQITEIILNSLFLIERMIRHGDTLRTIAAKIGISYTSLQIRIKTIPRLNQILVDQRGEDYSPNQNILSTPTPTLNQARVIFRAALSGFPQEIQAKMAGIERNKLLSWISTYQIFIPPKLPLSESYCLTGYRGHCDADNGYHCSRFGYCEVRVDWGQTPELGSDKTWQKYRNDFQLALRLFLCNAPKDLLDGLYSHLKDLLDDPDNLTSKSIKELI